MRFLLPATLLLCSVHASAALYTVDVFGVVEASGTMLMLDIPDPGPLGLGGDDFHWRVGFDSDGRDEGRIYVSELSIFGGSERWICDAPPPGGPLYQGENCQGNPSYVSLENPELGLYEFQLSSYAQSVNFVANLDTLTVEYFSGGTSWPAVPTEFGVHWVPIANQNSWAAFGSQFYTNDANGPRAVRSGTQ